jgi:hypothetical protein
MMADFGAGTIALEVTAAFFALGWLAFLTVFLATGFTVFFAVDFTAVFFVVVFLAVGLTTFFATGFFLLTVFFLVVAILTSL